MTKIKHVALLMAMEDEARPLIDALGLQPCHQCVDERLPMKGFCGGDADFKVSLVINGIDERYNVDNIGTQAATLSAYSVIQSASPDVLISAGTAGGFKQLGANIGTIYVSNEKFIFHDRRVPIAGFDESSIGHYPSLNVRQMAHDLGFFTGIISSGSSLQKNEQDVAIIEQYGAVAKEMEAAAIAWVAWILKVPFFAVKSITNLLDEPGPSETQFLQNLSYSCEQLTVSITKIIEYMSTRTLNCLSK